MAEEKVKDFPNLVKRGAVVCDVDRESFTLYVQRRKAERDKDARLSQLEGELASMRALVEGLMAGKAKK